MKRSYGLKQNPLILKSIMFGTLAFISLAIVGCGKKPINPANYPPTSSSEISEYDMTWHILSQLEEPAFSRRNGKVKSRYRFLWYPSLRRTPLVLRIENRSSDTLLMSIKFASGLPDREIEVMGYEDIPGLESFRMSVKIDKTIELSVDEFTQFESLFAKLNICDSPPKTGGGLDGASWLFEYEANGRHCAQSLHSPQDRKYIELGNYLTKLAGLSQIEL